MKRVIIALGGNAILTRGELGTTLEQQANVDRTIACISGILTQPGCEIVITHGNGPQVGNIIIQNDLASDHIPAKPMYVCDAMSQGEIGYMIEQSLENFFSDKHPRRKIATLISRIIVSKKDPALTNPTKPVGPFYPKGKADFIASKTGFVFKKDRGEFRRVVPSPEPLEIIGIESIESLLKSKFIVITAGGGGIPVILEGNKTIGIDAVIDKDKASALLGNLINADTFLILTGTDSVFLNYGTSGEIPLRNITAKEAGEYLKSGHFAEGSMKPKIEAVIKFLGNNKNRKALITSPAKLAEALEGKNGTWITS